MQRVNVGFNERRVSQVLVGLRNAVAVVFESGVRV